MLRRFAFASVALSFVALAPAACRPGEEVSLASAGSDLSMSDLPVKITAPVAGQLDQALDHPVAAAADPTPTFKQRYWYTTEFAQGPDSPTLLYLCGEQTCDDSFLSRMADTAKVLHASIALLEHRYYGRSKPFVPAKADDFKYLTIHNALEDIASFQAYAKSSLGLSGKWIVAGGSYAGMLAAFFRLKHPELVVGAWSSSAPVDVQLTFWGWDAVASRALGSECTLLMQQALDAAGRAYDDPTQLASLSTALFGSPWRPEFGSKRDFEAAVSGSVSGDIQVGHASALCAALEQHRLAPLDGVVGYLNPPLTPDDAAPDAAAPPPASPTKAEVVALGPGAGAARPRPDDGGNVPQDLSEYGWFWQTCSEVGFFQIANPDRTQSLLPSGVDGSSDLSGCDFVFHRRPDIAATRAAYYQPLLDGKASNIFFVNGTFDPWSSLSFVDPAAPPPGNTVFVIQQGAHHSELVSLQKDSPLGVFEAHFQFAKLAKTWLAAP